MKNVEVEIYNSLLGLLKKQHVSVVEEEIGEGQKSIIATFNFGSTDNSIQLDYMFSFIKIHQETQMAFLNCQMFVEISGLVNSENRQDLTWMITKINTFLPIGAFGIFEQFGLLYWKQNTFLDKSLAANQNAKMILAEVIFSQNVILDFRNSLLNFLLNRKSAMDALKENKWASLMFQTQ
jgi:hypothetical protein